MHGGPRAIERLNEQAAKLRNRLDQIYLDKLNCEIDESFDRYHVAAWTKEQAQVRRRIERHERANKTYIDQGIRLLELARNAAKFFRTHGQEERAILLRFHGCVLKLRRPLSFLVDEPSDWRC